MTCWCGGGIVFTPAGREACAESAFHDPLDDGRPTEVVRLYVALPMSGYPENNYPAAHYAADRLRDAGYIVVNPAEYGDVGGATSYQALLRRDLQEMLTCHGVAMGESWWESTGARNEVMVAGLLRMPCRTVNDWLHLAKKEN